MIRTARAVRGAMAVPTNDPPPRQESDPTEQDHPLRRALNSEDLLQGNNEVIIRHRGELYRLRETKNGKLLLLK